MKVIKVKSATRSSGRGMDNTRTPAQYGVYDDAGTLCGYLNADAVRQYEKPTWVWSSLEHRTIKRFHKGFRAAKQAIEEGTSGKVAHPDTRNYANA